MKKIDFVLLCCIFFILFIILMGTCLVFFSGKLSSAASAKKTEVIELPAGFSTFQLGTIRVSTADNPPVPVVVSPYFPYNQEDSQFFEELCSKETSLKRIFPLYFSKFTKEQLQKKGEAVLKQELIYLLNDKLVLGKIEDLYFSEYIFFD